MLSTASILPLFLATVLSVPALGAELSPAELDELYLYFKDDQLVEVETRSPKPLNQVAENVTVITAEEIEGMNAHTVAEVLNRVPGIIMEGSYTDFGSSSTIFIQGSDYEHVLVLLDGIRWGYVSFDYAETNTIPVQIIKRIEIIKGAASSTWGSSLGGVVNIITKDTGKDAIPTGSLSGSYGENSTTHLRGDAAGMLGRLGYYIYGSYQESDGIEDSRFFDNKNFYVKLQLDLPNQIDIGGTFGHNRPEYKYYHIPAWDEEGVINDRVYNATAFFTAPLGNTVTLNLNGYWFKDTFTDKWQPISAGIPINKVRYKGESTGASGRLVWDTNTQTLVLGMDYERRENTETDQLTSYTSKSQHDEIWAFFINDTIRLNRLTVIPGLRYDHLSIADDKISPSLGLTYQVNDKTLLRGNVSRGFRKPYASIKTGDSLFFPEANPDLESEEITSFQAGVENNAIPFVKIKANLFLHRAVDVWVNDPDTFIFVNNGDFDRQGVELELQTASFHNFSASVNGLYLRMKPDDESSATHYEANILVKYDDGTWRGQLFGHNVWLGDVSPPVTWDDETGTFIWDLVLGRRFHLQQDTSAELFAELHNVFDDDQYFQWVFPNAGRWFEAGIRFTY